MSEVWRENFGAPVFVGKKRAKHLTGSSAGQLLAKSARSGGSARLCQLHLGSTTSSNALRTRWLKFWVGFCASKADVCGKDCTHVVCSSVLQDETGDQWMDIILVFVGKKASQGLLGVIAHLVL